MLDKSLDGGFANAPVEAAKAFRAALNALSRPGVIEEVSGAAAPAPVSGAAAALLLTLCDAETPLYLGEGFDGEDVKAWVAFHTSAPLAEPEEAMFALGRWESLPLGRFPVGTSEYPDRSTTVIVEVGALAAEGAVLSGPGIKGKAALSLPEVLAFQDNRALYPLGLDFYFTCGQRLAGLPRSTIVEAS